jgi:cytochrome c-type biogenesis protein CcmH
VAPATSAGAPGPTAADMAAAANLSADDRSAMIRAMVQRLADKMAQTPGDVDGWMRLGRAYSVLGEQQKSLDAYRHASEADPSREDAKAAYAQARAAAGAAQ